MDIFGAVVNAIHCARKIIEYVKDVRGADQDRENLLSGLSRLASVLDQIQGHADRQPLTADLQSALNSPSGLLPQLQSTLDGIQTWLEKDSMNSPNSLSSKLKWPFQKNEVAENIRKIADLEAQISLVLQVSSR
jgi:hypothetical protein